jgi:hypothetical protein
MGTGGIVCVDEPHRKWAETELTALRIVATGTTQFTKAPAVRPPHDGRGNCRARWQGRGSLRGVGRFAVHVATRQ